jgi:imidazolonepropionase
MPLYQVYFTIFACEKVPILMRILIKNIKGLVGTYDGRIRSVRGNQMNSLPIIENAFLAIEDGEIALFGSMDEWGGITDWRNLEVIDAEGRFVLPAWCDSHTHLVFAASRELEFEDRIKGLTYEEIAARGGGILNSADKLGGISEDELYDKAIPRLESAMLSGTGAIEIKSGYGLSKESELKMLRVIKRHRESYELTIKSTFLGAHAIPANYKGKQSDYVSLVVDEILPEVAENNLADYIDVFCEKGYFTVEETLKIVEAGAKFGLKSKIHVNQFNSLDAIPKLVSEGVLSVDHLEVLTDSDLKALSGSSTIATALPLCSLFLSIPYTPMRKLIDHGVIAAIATDFNPGSAPSSNMSLAVSMACIKMNLTPHEAINAATINGAAAMEVSQKLGSITEGKRANLIISEKCDHLSYLPYSFGVPAIDSMILNGKILKDFR